MAKRKILHGAGVGKKALAYWCSMGSGPMLNARHPKKCPPIMKKTAPSAANTESGRETPQSH